MFYWLVQIALLILPFNTFYYRNEQQQQTTATTNNEMDKMVIVLPSK